MTLTLDRVERVGLENRFNITVSALMRADRISTRLFTALEALMSEDNPNVRLAALHLTAVKLQDSGMCAYSVIEDLFKSQSGV
jgi:hypothetical protein